MLHTLFTKSYGYWWTTVHKYWERLGFFVWFFFFVRYWDNTTYGKLKQWRQPANETKVMCTKKKIKPKSATQASLSLKIKTKSSKFSITHFNKNANWLKGEITVNSHWARFSALDVRQTFRSLFQSVVKLRFRSIPGIYIWKKQL